MSWLLNLSEETREMVRKDIKEFADTRALEVDSHSITLFMLEEITETRKRLKTAESNLEAVKAAFMEFKRDTERKLY